jgi:hypothetical protein
MSVPKNRFAFVFKPGEHIPEVAFNRFEQFLPRLEHELDEHYARRLEAAGLAILIRSDDMRDSASYRATIAQAEDAGLPLAMLTGAIPDPGRDRMQERETRSPQDYLTEARARAAGITDTTGAN